MTIQIIPFSYQSKKLVSASKKVLRKKYCVLISIYKKAARFISHCGIEFHNHLIKKLCRLLPTELSIR